MSSFESSVQWLLKSAFRGAQDVKAVLVSGVGAVSFATTRPSIYRGQQVTLEDRETWIGVPGGPIIGGATVFRFFTTVEPSNPHREANVRAYERMLASMRIDPVALTRAMDGYRRP